MSRKPVRPRRTDARWTAVHDLGRSLRVAAGAGSGKTTILVDRFLHAITKGGLDPDRILAITFTDKAANEMKSRLVAECRRRGLEGARRRLENAYIGTIHSFCARILRENPIEAGLDPYFQILSEGEADLLREKSLDAVFEGESAEADVLPLLIEYNEKSVRENIRRFYERIRAFPDEKKIYAASAGRDVLTARFLRLAERFRERYEAEKKKRAQYDFDDLMSRADEIFAGESAACCSIRERYARRFALVFVDEFQDTSPLQVRLIRRISGPKNLFVVGDVQQSIYGFRYADPGVFRSSGRGRGEPRFEELSLRENFRSRAGLLKFVNTLSSRLFSERTFSPLIPMKRFPPDTKPPVEWFCVRSSEDAPVNLDEARVREGRVLARRVREWVESGSEILDRDGNPRPLRYGDIAILFRRKRPIRYYEKELIEAGVPCYTEKGHGFYDKQEILDLVHFLRLIENPSQQDISLASVLRSPLVGLSEESLFWLARSAKEKDSKAPLYGALERIGEIESLGSEDRARLERFRDLLEEMRRPQAMAAVPDILSRLLEKTRYETRILAKPGGRQALANVRKLTDIARTLEDRGIRGVRDFISFLKSLSEREIPEREAAVQGEGSDAVLVSTIHAAKGLEFPYVVLADLGSPLTQSADDLFVFDPDEGIGRKARGEDDKYEKDEIFRRIEAKVKARAQEEEGRLLYVAMTRARERLLLSGALPKTRRDSWMLRMAPLFNEARPKGPGVEWEGIPLKVLREEGSGAVPREKKILLSEHPAVRESLSTGRSMKGPEARGLGLIPDEGAAERLERRIATDKKDYRETADVSVTELLSASLKEGGRPGQRFRPEPKAGETENEQETEETAPGNEYGNTYHRIMEYLGRQRPRKWSASSWVRSQIRSLSAAERGRLEREVASFWEGPLGAEIRAASRIYPELPFIYKTGSGILKGQMDLVYQDPKGEWVVLDYKTTRIRPSDKAQTARTYALQLALYAFVFSELYGEIPRRGVLYFSALEDSALFNYTEKDLKNLRAVLEDAHKKWLIFQAV